MRRHATEFLAVGLAGCSAIAVAAAGHGAAGPAASPWFAIPAAAAIPLPLLARRRFPDGGPAAVWILAATVSFVDGRVVVCAAPTLVAGLAAAFLLGNRASRSPGWPGLACVLLSATVIVADDPLRDGAELLAIPALATAAWWTGLAARREREAGERVASAEERTRIARELHDVLGHALTVTVLQVGMVRRRIEEARPEEAETLEGIEQAAGEALAEVRGLVTTMRRGEGRGPAPVEALARIDTLVDRVRAAGLQVEVRVVGTPRPLPDRVESAALRIAQEALTNVLRHAHAGHAELVLRYDPAGLEVEVTDDGPGAAETTLPGSGLLGLEERARSVGGTVEAGPCPEGGFRVRAELPVESSRPLGRHVRRPQPARRERSGASRRKPYRFPAARLKVDSARPLESTAREKAT